MKLNKKGQGLENGIGKEVQVLEKQILTLQEFKVDFKELMVD